MTQARRLSGFADACGSDQDDILRLGDKLQFGEGLDLLAVDPGLTGEGEAGQRPALRQLRLLDASRQSRLLAVVPLRPQQAGEVKRLTFSTRAIFRR